MPRQWLYSLVLGLLVLAGCSTQGPLQTQREAGAPTTLPTSPEAVGPAAAPQRPPPGLALGGGAARGFAHI
ncbi:MAG: patatin-like phospholipase family protein, partial [Limnohabitans sp.]|nr:patatin-like phospholipase family protein [Limnohabitans sp.]